MPDDPAAVWLPSYAWWPHPDHFSASLMLSTYQVADEPEAEFEVICRGYAGSADPLWELEVGRLRAGEQRPVQLSELDVPPPPEPQGGILEVHSVRLDRPPGKGGVESAFHWVDAQGVDGGGYIIPTAPYRGGVKIIERDDVQVIPGVIATREVETELLLLNLVPDSTEVRLVVSSTDGLQATSEPFAIEPWSAWRGELSRVVPRVQKLLANEEGIGSLLVESSRKLHPFFGFRMGSNPVVSMDHAAPIFA